MFIFTARLRRGRLIAGGLAVLCGGLVVAGLLLFRGGAVGAAGAVKGIRTPEDRLSYLEELGWTVNPQPLAIEELMIPKAFDEDYTDYLQLQTEAGFDLTEYCGKRVKRYTYEITNYPSGEKGVQLSLLVYKNRIIGGDVLSPQLNGFLHGLNRPSAPGPNPTAAPSPSPSSTPAPGTSPDSTPAPTSAPTL